MGRVFICPICFYLNVMRRRKERKRKHFRNILVFLAIAIIAFICMKHFEIGIFSNRYVEQKPDNMEIEQPEMQVKLLTINPYSRPGFRSEKIQNIVIHYTANPGTSAMQNRNYFEGLKDSRKTKASSHFIVGIEGEIVQCVPTWEIAYASNERNIDSVSIETCHKGEDGSYTKETYESMVHLTAWLCEKFQLTEKDLIRHYDVTGKECPKYFVDNEEAWETFRLDVKKTLEEKSL